MSALEEVEQAVQMRCIACVVLGICSNHQQLSASSEAVPAGIGRENRGTDASALSKLNS